MKRITILDSLRGFALLGVILIHMIQHFGIFSMQNVNETLRFLELDQAVQWIGNNIIMGRFINIFAVLFGLSFFIQMDKASQKGIDFRARFAWRMIVLLAMGLVSHSFFNIEIISVYGFFGLLMIPLFRVKQWVLLVLIAFLLLGGPRVMQAVNHNNNIKNSQIDTQEQINTLAVSEEVTESSFLNSAKFNYQERFPGKLNYQFSFVGRGYITFALFLLGLLLGRHRFFENSANNKKRNGLLFIGFLVSTITITWVQTLFPALNIFMFFRPEGQVFDREILLVKTLEDINLVLFTGCITLGFVLIYNSHRFGKYLEVLEPYGRTALTNYIMQGIIGSLIFSAWAFGSTFSGWGFTALVILGIVIYIVQIISSKIWLSYFNYGPLEWLWRSLTYLKFQPFRKTQ